MRRVILLMLLMLLMLCPPAMSAAPTVVPVEATVVEPTPADGPQASLRRMSRTERKLAREVRNDAAEALGLTRLAFMRRWIAGEKEAREQLKLSFAEHPDAREIDIDRWNEIFAMIMEWIKQIMAIFALFADNATLDAIDEWVVNVGFDLAERLAA